MAEEQQHGRSRVARFKRISEKMFPALSLPSFQSGKTQQELKELAAKKMQADSSKNTDSKQHLDLDPPPHFTHSKHKVYRNWAQEQAWEGVVTYYIMAEQWLERYWQLHYKLEPKGGMNRVSRLQKARYAVAEAEERFEKFVGTFNKNCDKQDLVLTDVLLCRNLIEDCRMAVDTTWNDFIWD